MDKDLKNTLPLNLKMFRLEKGLKQKELADLIGVSNKRLSNWERGLSIPPQKFLSRICSILNVSITDLITLPTEKIKDDPFLMSYDDHILLNRFNNLDEEGKRFVLTVLKHEEERLRNG